jgi:hypothetical protein
MGTPTTWRDCRLGTAALEALEFIVGKGANRIRAVPFHSIRSSGNLRRSSSGRWRERRPALIQFAHSTNINSVRYSARGLRRTSRLVVGIHLEIRL